MLKQYLILIIMVLFQQTGRADYAEEYIKTYKDIAISEMIRVGIPASIILAQGMLSSDFGRDEFVQKTKNHFGIKCGSKWRGRMFHKMNNERLPNGKLVSSCFRAYSSVEKSYVAHSDFLMAPKRKTRYGFLFEYDTKDYVSWARGLLKSGYATDKEYANKLVALIENYELYNFDKETVNTPNDIVDNGNHKEESLPKISTETINKVKHKPKESKLEETKVFVPHIPKKPIVDSDFDWELNDIFTRFGVKCVVAQKDDTPLIIAERYNIFIDRLLSYNKGIRSNYKFQKGDFVYLGYKKNTYLGRRKFHKIKEGETMFTIAQKYGIKLMDLYIKNKMPKNAVPLLGERIILNRVNIYQKSPEYIIKNK